MNDAALDALLIFTDDAPCWTEKMFRDAGVDVNIVRALAEENFVENDGEIFFLSEKGRAEFERQAAENWLPIKPGEPGTDIFRTAFACELKFLLDKRHVQRWGLKEYIAPFRVKLPDISAGDLFETDGAKIIWRWPDAPVFQKMRADFPNTGLAARENSVPDKTEINNWLRDNAAPVREVVFDLLYKSRYDFESYAHFAPRPGDEWNFFNADRFLFTAPDAEQMNDESFYLTRVGEFHMFLEILRRLWLPGYADSDALEQDAVNWLLFAFQTEDESQRCASLLSRFGEDIAGPAAPLEIWSVSLESLRNYPGGTLENIWDILPFAARPVYRLT